MIIKGNTVGTTQKPIRNSYFCDSWEAIDQHILTELNLMMAQYGREPCVKKLSLRCDTTSLWGAALVTIHKYLDSDNIPAVSITMQDSNGNRLQKYGVDEGNAWWLSDWEWDNPPMETGVEYKTTERRDHIAVYKMLDASGNILWRTADEETWRYQDIVRVEQYITSLDALSEFIVSAAYNLSDNSVKRFSLMLGMNDFSNSGMLTLCRTLSDDKFPEVLATLEDSSGAKVHCTFSEAGLDEDDRFVFVQDVDWEWVNPPLVPGTVYRTTERRNGKAVYKKLDADGVLKYRLDGESVWNTYAGETGAAPAGYGLGTGAKYVADLNTCLSNGWYYVRQNTKNVPAGFDFGSVFVQARNIPGAPEQVVQYLFSHFTSNLDGTPTTRCQLIRHTTDGGEKWTTEWVNPPMQPNTEYRTTERNNGKEVYVQCIYFGGLPAAGYKYVTFIDEKYRSTLKIVEMRAYLRSPTYRWWHDVSTLDVIQEAPHVVANQVGMSVNQAYNIDNDVYIFLKYSKV